MAVSHGFGKIVTDGLVLALDAADANSYTSGSTTWNDLSGNGNNGTLTNGPTFDSANGGSIVFDGSNDYVEITSLGYPWSTSTITVNLWYYPLSSNPKTSGTDCNLITVENSFEISIGNKNNGYSKIYYASNPWAWKGDGGNNMSNDQWNMITFVHSLTDRKMYVNGSLVYTFNDTGGLASGSSSQPSLLLMKRYCCGGSFASGNLANVGLFNRPLSPSEILQNYNTLKPRFGL